VDNFWNKIEMIPEHPCWEWIGQKDKDGYGRLKMNRRDLRAHRLSYEIHKGVIPQGRLVCHTCDNTSCVNPNHLFLGTHRDNVRDCINKNRRADCESFLVAYPGESNPAAILTKFQVDQIRFKYKNEKITQKTLAKLFNVCEATISHIITRRIWK
jgi:hypothetical protein